MTSLSALGNISSSASHVTPNGSFIVGSGTTLSGVQGFLLNAVPAVQFLGTLGGSGSFNRSEASSCTADGAVVVGASYNPSNRLRAFRWSSAQGMADLGVLTGGDFARAYDISADGSVIVGHSSDSTAYEKPCFWQNGTTHQLLTTLLSSAPRGSATAIRLDGLAICGWVVDPNTNREHAYLWAGSGGTSPVDLGVLPGVPLDQGMSYAYGISSSNQIVGKATDSLGDYSAFYWYDGVMEDLNATYSGTIGAGSRLVTANSISHDGRFIVGQGFNASSGRTEAFILDRGATTSIAGGLDSPLSFALEQNYPNPFNPLTHIRFSLPSSSWVRLVVFNSAGQAVATLANEYLAPGNYDFTFNAARLPSGVYFYQVSAGSFQKVMKMVFLK